MFDVTTPNETFPVCGGQFLTASPETKENNVQEPQINDK